MTDDPRKRGADIEIYEETDTESSVTRPRFIRINGTDIGYTSLSGIDIEADSTNGLRVTITLFPRSLTVHQVRPDPVEDEPFWTRKSTLRDSGIKVNPGQPVTFIGHEEIKEALKKGTDYIRAFYGDGHHNHRHTDKGKD